MNAQCELLILKHKLDVLCISFNIQTILLLSSTGEIFWRTPKAVAKVVASCLLSQFFTPLLEPL